MARADDIAEAAILAPARTPRLVGHDEARRRILRAFASGRAHHAWLISGREGIGKATLAWHMARLLLAFPGREIANAPAEDLPPDHPVSHQVAAISHPDLFLLRRTRDRQGRLRAGIVVDDVRALSHFLSLRPGQGGRRVVIIDTADEMNISAANALLKVLEEPPRETFFFLVSHAPGRLLPTIRSRCLHVPLDPLSPDQVRAVLAMEEVMQGRDVPADTLEKALKLAAGSPGLALKYAEGAAAESFFALTAALDGDMGAHAFRELAAKTARAQASASARNDFFLLMELLINWLREHAREAGHQGALARATELAELAATLREELARLDALNLDRRQLMESALLRMHAALKGARAA